MVLFWAMVCATAVGAEWPQSVHTRAHRRSEQQDWIVESGFGTIEESMSLPSWITPVLFVQRPAFLRPQCATDFADREKFGARSAVNRSSRQLQLRPWKDGALTEHFG